MIRRAGIAAPILLAILAAPAASGSGTIETDAFDEVGRVVDSLAGIHGPGGVLLVFDLDNTLLAMDDPLGSPQWFDWQDSLITADSDSPLRAREDFRGLLDLQGLIFALGGMHATEADLPARIAGWQEAGHDCMVLSSREPSFDDATLRELDAAGMDFSASTPDAGCSFGGVLLPYAPEDVPASGLTPAEASAFGLGPPREVRYESGVLSVAGQHKGAMLLILLAHSARYYPAVVFVDDEAVNVERVYAALSGRGIGIAAFRYGGEDPVVAAFDSTEKEDAAGRLAILEQVLEAVFPEPSGG